MENSESGGAPTRWVATFVVLFVLFVILAASAVQLDRKWEQMARPPVLVSSFLRADIEVKEGARGCTRVEEYNLTCTRARPADAFDCVYPNGTVRSVPLVHAGVARPASFLQCARTELDGGGAIVWPNTCFLCVGAECHPQGLAATAGMSAEQLNEYMLWDYAQTAFICSSVVTMFIFLVS